MDYSEENIRNMTQFDKAIKIQCYRREIQNKYSELSFIVKRKLGISFI